MDIFRDASEPIERRVADLLSRLTLAEKIAQLGSLYADELLEAKEFSDSKAGEWLTNGIGHISAIGRTSGFKARELAAFSNAIQRYLIEKTRLGIPALIHEECLNGFRARGSAIFPQNIGLAATWNRALVQQMTSLIRRQMRATGVHQGLAPVLDVARDPRWGRMEETFGEDPFLVAEMGLAYIRGLQGSGAAAGVAATVKHFVGHGLSEGGLNCAPAQIPPRLLKDVYLYPFEKAIKRAGTLSLMHAYHELDGLPCGASSELLTDLLRHEWGFAGLVVSDYYAIGQLLTVHHICADIDEAAATALSAGIDLELPKTHAFGSPLQHQVESGRVPIALVDRAVERVLRLKFQLGLFEQPYVEAAGPIDLDTPADRRLALEIACQSIVLLKNEKQRLPLAKTIRSLAVIGPSADSLRNLLGDYTFPAGAGYELASNPQNGQVEVVWKDREMLEGRIAAPAIISVLEGIRQTVDTATQVLYARGCEINGGDTSGFDEALRAARSAEAAVVVVGGISGMLPQCTSGEMRDSLSLTLPGVQAELVSAVLATGTPLILVIISGRPLVLGRLANQLEAIIQAWLPGEEGGRAVAAVLFGEYNPGGKLPVSLPSAAGQLPVYYGHKPSGGRSSLWGDYADGPVNPAFEFGWGLSYTSFSFEHLEIQPRRITAAGEISVKLDVTNTGTRAGDEVVQLYIQDVVASLTRPVQQLKGFERVHLLPGQTQTVSLRLPAQELAFCGRDMQPVIEPGLFRVMVGNSSHNILLEDQFEVIEDGD
jgi:beta-glucosidase